MSPTCRVSIAVREQRHPALFCILFSFSVIVERTDAEWSSSVARRAHNPEVVGSNPASATNSRSPYQV